MKVYHVGNLAKDRGDDASLDARAREMLERSFPLGRKVFPEMGNDSPRGRGEGHLTQRKLWAGVYEYRFTPIKGIKI